MVEYLNMDYLSTDIFLSVLIVIFLVSLKVKRNIVYVLVVGFLTVIYSATFYDSYNISKTVQEFKNDKSIQCIASSCAQSAAKYKVSKSTGWKLEGKYYIQNSLMLDVSWCGEF